MRNESRESEFVPWLDQLDTDLRNCWERAWDVLQEIEDFADLINEMRIEEIHAAFDRMREYCTALEQAHNRLELELIACGEFMLTEGELPAIDGVEAIRYSAERLIHFAYYEASNRRPWYTSRPSAGVKDELRAYWDELRIPIQDRFRAVDLNFLEMQCKRVISKAQHQRNLFKPIRVAATDGKAPSGRPSGRHNLVAFAKSLREQSPGITRTQIVSKWNEQNPQDLVDSEMLRKAEQYHSRPRPKPGQKPPK